MSIKLNGNIIRINWSVVYEYKSRRVECEIRIKSREIFGNEYNNSSEICVKGFPI